MFDVNAWAREFYLDANQHLVPKNGSIASLYDKVSVNVTEMTLGGFITKEEMRSGSAKIAPQAPPTHGEPELFPTPSPQEQVESQKRNADTRWTTVNDPAVDNVGSDDFSLAEVSKAPADTVRDLYTTTAKTR